MAKRMHSRSLLFFEKELELDAHLIVENFRSYSSIIITNTGGAYTENARYVEISIIPGNTISLNSSGLWSVIANSEGDKLELSFYDNDTPGAIYGLVIWGVK